MKKAQFLSIALVLTACGDREEAAPAPAAATPATPATPTAAAAPASAPTEAPVPAVAIGSEAPDFTLTDHSGATHRLSQYRGRVVVLEWTNPTCPYVVRHTTAGTMRTLDAAFADTDVVWLAIDSTRTVVPADSAAAREAAQLAYLMAPRAEARGSDLADCRGTSPPRFAARTSHRACWDPRRVPTDCAVAPDQPQMTQSAPRSGADFSPWLSVGSLPRASARGAQDHRRRRLRHVRRLRLQWLLHHQCVGERPRLPHRHRALYDAALRCRERHRRMGLSRLLISRARRRAAHAGASRRGADALRYHAARPCRNRSLPNRASSGSRPSASMYPRATTMNWRL
jgi:hypothetical protein